MKVIVLGGGGHCQALLGVLQSIPGIDVLGLVLPSGSDAPTRFGYAAVGTDNDLDELRARADSVVVALGGPFLLHDRARLYARAVRAGFATPSVLAPSATISPGVEIRDGVQVMPGAVVNTGAYVGYNSIVNSLALVEHGAVVGPNSHIATGARVNGECHIGSQCFVGSGAVIREGVTIGDGSVIGAGSLIGFDVPAGTRLRAQWSTP